MYSTFENLPYALYIFFSLSLAAYIIYQNFGQYLVEFLKTREAKKKLWREFRFTYWELMNNLSKQEMNEMVKTFNNTYKNAKIPKQKCADNVVIDFSPKRFRKQIRKVSFDLPSREF